MQFQPAIPTRGAKVPAGPEWLHEVKYDGFRRIVSRDGDRVRLITGGGYDWSKRYPWIVESALKNRIKQFVIDGEAVVLGVDGISDFEALYSRKHDDEVQLYAFDILALDGKDLRGLPLSMRKTNLAPARWHLRRAVRGRRDRICSWRPAGWGWRVWSRSGGTARIRLAGRSIGSRSRTAAIRQ